MIKHSILQYESSYFICLLNDGFIAIGLHRPTENEVFAQIMAVFINQYGYRTPDHRRAESAFIHSRNIFAMTRAPKLYPLRIISRYSTQP